MKSARKWLDPGSPTVITCCGLPGVSHSSDSSQVLMWALFSSTLFLWSPGQSQVQSWTVRQPHCKNLSFLIVSTKGPGILIVLPWVTCLSLNQSLQMVEVGRGEQCSDQDWVGSAPWLSVGKWFPGEKLGSSFSRREDV